MGASPSTCCLARLRLLGLAVEERARSLSCQTYVLHKQGDTNVSHLADDLATDKDSTGTASLLMCITLRSLYLLVSLMDLTRHKNLLLSQRSGSA